MAYDPCNLSAMTYANGTTWWSYKHTGEDSPWAPGFFDDAQNMLRVGDLLHIVWTPQYVPDEDCGGLSTVRRIGPGVQISNRMGG